MSLRSRKNAERRFENKQFISKTEQVKNDSSPVSSGSEVDNDSIETSISDEVDRNGNDILTHKAPQTAPHEAYNDKRSLICEALSRHPIDVDKLRQLSISRGGLLDNDLRRKAWPCLLDIDVEDIPDKPSEEELRGHRDYKQVLLDVNRSAKRFPPGMQEEVRLSYQDQLIECIMWILLSNIDLHYYQGFHDVVVTFLLVVGEELTFALVDRLCKNHFRDFMHRTMEETNGMLSYLLPIISKANAPLRTFLERSEVGTIFCLPWLITWYGHVLNNLKDIVRLYDFFIACHPLMPIYLAADIVLYRGEAVMECECEMPYVHKLLSRLPDDLPFEQLISRAGDLFLQYPPSVLQQEAKLHRQQELRALKEKQEQDRLRMSLRRKGAVGRRWVKRVERRYLVCGVLMGALTAVTAVAVNYWRGGGMRLDWPVNLLST